MLRFFRRLRKKLLAQGKVQMYFFYAIGEIALVMIGILLALQVNNWNETRKEIKRERAILHKTLEDINTDATTISTIVDKTDQIFNVHQNLISLAKGEISQDSVGNIDLIRLTEPNVLITNKNNPALVRQISDEKLKRFIQDYFKHIEKLEFTLYNHNQIIEDYIRPYLGQKKMLIYGNQFQNELGTLKLIDRNIFFSEFKNEEMRQLLFESGIKVRIMLKNASQTEELIARLSQVIRDKLEQSKSL